MEYSLEELAEKDAVVEAVFSSNDGVSKQVLRQAELRLQALQTAAHALDQRMTQVAAFQFAAAAFTGGSALLETTGMFSALASVAFVVGGVVSFRGIRSDPIHLPGIIPSWWGGNYWA